MKNKPTATAQTGGDLRTGRIEARAPATVRAQLELYGFKVERVRPRDFYAQCPVCRANEATLRVSCGADAVVFHCHSGQCDEPPPEFFENVCRELKLYEHELFYSEDVPEDPPRARTYAGGGCGWSSGSSCGTTGVEVTPDAGNGTSCLEKFNEADDDVPENVVGEGGRPPAMEHWLPRAGAAYREERLRLVREWRENRLVDQPVWVDEWPELPDDTMPLRRRVAGHCQLVRALMLSVGDDRPFVLPMDEVAAELGIAKIRASNAMKWLREIGFLKDAGQLAPHSNDRYGAFLYEPGLVTDVATPAEVGEAAFPAVASGIEADGAGRIDAGEEVGEDVPVGQAVTLDGREVFERDG
jgi:hypothetical protein